MKTLFNFLAVICAAYAHNLTCLVYNCSEKTVRENEVCAIQGVDDLVLNKCDEGLICQPIEFGSFSVCVKKVIPDKSILPGEMCTEDKQCIVGICKGVEKNRICEGTLKGNKCNFTSECDKGLHCKGDNCEKTMEKGEECNKNDNICSVNLICDRLNYTCIEYGSIDVNEPAPFPAACKTYHQDENGKCIRAPKLATPGKFNCPSTDSEFKKCEYLRDEEPVKTPCGCAKVDTEPNTNRKRCLPGKGDIDVNIVILMLTRIANRIFKEE